MIFDIWARTRSHLASWGEKAYEESSLDDSLRLQRLQPLAAPWIRLRLGTRMVGSVSQSQFGSAGVGLLKCSSTRRSVHESPKRTMFRKNSLAYGAKFLRNILDNYDDCCSVKCTDHSITEPHWTISPVRDEDLVGSADSGASGVECDGRRVCVAAYAG